MMPVLLQFGPLKVHTYGFMMALGFFVAGFFYQRDVKRYIAPLRGLTPEQSLQKVLDLFTMIVPVGILGGRLLYVIEYRHEFRNDPLSVLYLWDGGLVFFGGFVLVVAATVWWFKREHWPLALSYDLIIPWLALGHAFGRIGCFSSGCCYGRVCDPAHGVVFPNLDGLPHYPTQLWESAGNLTICLTLLFLRRGILRRPWMSMSVYAVLYGILRFNMEIWRYEPGTPMFGPFVSHSQAFSALLVLAGVMTGLVLSLKSRRS